MSTGDIQRLCGMVHKLQKQFAIMDQTMVTSGEQKFDFATLRKNRETHVEAVPVIPYDVFQTLVDLSRLKDVPVLDAHTG